MTILQKTLKNYDPKTLNPTLQTDKTVDCKVLLLLVSLNKHTIWWPHTQYYY